MGDDTLSVLRCFICESVCRRAVYLRCCGPMSQACRACAVKTLTSSRTCWHCNHPGVSLEQDLVIWDLVRDACSSYKEKGKLEGESIEAIKKVKIDYSKTGGSSKKLEKLEDDEKEMCRKLLEIEEEKRKKVEEEEEIERKKKEKEDRLRREEREARRKKEKDKRREKEREERKKRDELKRILEKQRT